MSVVAAGCTPGEVEPNHALSTSEIENSSTDPTVESTSTTVTTSATSAVEARWPARESIVGYVIAVDQDPNYAVRELPEGGAEIGPAAVTLDSGLQLRVEGNILTSRVCAQLASDASPSSAPCLVLINASDGEIDEMLVVYDAPRSDDSELRPALDGPVLDIRQGSALFGTPYGNFTVPIADEVDMSGCGSGSVEELLRRRSAGTIFYFGDEGQIEAVECFGSA